MSPTVTQTCHAGKYKVHKLPQKFRVSSRGCTSGGICVFVLCIYLNASASVMEHFATLRSPLLNSAVFETSTLNTERETETERDTDADREKHRESQTETVFIFLPGVDAPHVYVGAWALGCFSSHY